MKLLAIVSAVVLAVAGAAVIVLLYPRTGSLPVRAEFELRPVAEMGQAPCAQGMTPSADGTECFRLSQGMSHIRPKRVAAGQVESDGRWIIQVTLAERDAAAFTELTTRLHQQPEPRNRLAVVVDGKVLTAPNVTSPIPGGALEISGEFTQKTATELAERLRDG